MTDRKAEIRERDEKATPGPWKLFHFLQGVYEVCKADNYACGGVCVSHIKADADFIAHARSDIPWLLSLVDEFEAQVASERDKALEEAAALCEKEAEKRHHRALNPEPGDEYLRPFPQDMVQDSLAIRCLKMAEEIRGLKSDGSKLNG
jgi:hypothetical protein